MLIFDQLKRTDAQLRLLAVVVTAGLLVLLAGLWWVQVVSFRDYQAHLETQSFRTVRVPAPRGKILDRNGIVLAENRPSYNISLYLEDLSDSFKREERHLRPKRVVTNSLPFWKRWLGASSVTTQDVKLTSDQFEAIRREARFNCVSNIVREVASALGHSLTLDPRDFNRQWATHYLPYPILKAANSNDIPRFEEQLSGTIAADLEVESIRDYPHGTTAAHLLGELRRDNDSIKGEDADFDYRLPDYGGLTGVEYAFNAQLHGRAGTKSVLINSSGYRRTENVWTPVEPGSNVVLTIDLYIQRKTEQALQSAAVDYSPVRGAAVVMDVRTGDILAMASAPTFNPNYFAQGFPPGESQRIQEIGAEKNRATQENYRPGSIFKTVIALACLENGLDDKAIYDVQPYPGQPWHGGILLQTKWIKDTVTPGPYDFVRALIHSSNAYFITNGVYVAGIEKIAQLARRLHFGESTGLATGQQLPGSWPGRGTRQEARGTFPTEKRIHSGWRDGDTANICIGQGLIDVTPLQMTVLAAALANGGYVLWPRLVDRLEPQDPVSNEPPSVFPKGRVRDTLGVGPRSLKIVRDAMLKDVEERGSTAYGAFNGPNGPYLPMRVCSKTGTAQNERGGVIDPTIATTWFLSFAPYENPRYAVVVMVERGHSGGETCAPIGRKIYEGILERERMDALKTGSLAQRN